MRHLFFIGVFVSCFAAMNTIAAFAKDKEQKEPVYKDGHRVWDLGLAHGTAAEIGATLNGQIERLAAHLTDKRARVVELTTLLKNARADAQDNLAKDSEYQRLQTQLATAEASKKTTSDATPDARLEASARVTKAKADLERRRKELVEASPAIAGPTRELAEAQTAARTLERSIGQQEIWRREIAEALRGAAILGWPSPRGSTGILGRIIPLRAIDSTSFEAGFMAGETQSVAGEKEGILTVMLRMHPVLVIVNGVDQPYEVGKPIAIDRMFEVTQTTTDAAGHEVWHVSPATQEKDRDELLSAVLVPPKSPAADELELLVKHAERKENPHTWLAPNAIVNAIPAELKIKKPGVSDEDRIQRQNEWLAREVAGDVINASMKLAAVSENADGLQIRATIHFAGESNHVFTLVSPNALHSTTMKLRDGQLLRVTGTIRSIRLHGDGSLECKVVEAAF